jgi:16S rRNA (uracil1498-N3)-methyltransferase
VHRFFVSPTLLHTGASVELVEQAHQICSVLRLQAGAEILLVDGSGFEYTARLTTVSSRRVEVEVGEAHPCAGEPELQLALYACTLKADKFEWVLQKGTELGVSRFVPVVSRRSIVRPAAALASKLPRWQTIVREAAEQAGRGRLPVVEPPADLAPALAAHNGVPGPRFVAWEGVLVSGLPVAAPLQDVLLRRRSNRAEVALLVGPEGGLEADEVEQAQAAGWLVVSMGPRILRAETAALAGVATLMALAGELGSFVCVDQAGAPRSTA